MLIILNDTVWGLNFLWNIEDERSEALESVLFLIIMEYDHNKTRDLCKILLKLGLH